MALVQGYINSKEKQKKLYRRTLIVIIISQIFGGVGLAAGITVGALLAQDIIGKGSISGIPVGLFTLGSAGAALLVGWMSQHFGRRLGLVMGFFTAGLGAIGVVISAVISNYLLLFVSLFIYGAGTATNLQVRYAGTDLAKTSQRGVAISIAMVSTTFGAIAGPNLVDAMGQLVLKFKIPSLAGPFVLAAIAFILAGLVILALLRPDPLIVARAIADKNREYEHELLDVDSDTMYKNKWGIVLGATVMIITQVVMIAIMTMTPIHMERYGYSLSDIGLIISIHIGALYFPSLITGIVVDKLGRIVMIIVSSVTLLSAGILASLAPVNTMFLLTFALTLLGLGWNFGLISGTALIVDSTNLLNRAKIQAYIDVLVSVIGSLGGVVAGVVVTRFGYSILSSTSGILALILIPIVIFLQHRIRVNSLCE